MNEEVIEQDWKFKLKRVYHTDFDEMTDFEQLNLFFKRGIDYKGYYYTNKGKVCFFNVYKDDEDEEDSECTIAVGEVITCLSNYLSVDYNIDRWNNGRHLEILKELVKNDDNFFYFPERRVFWKILKERFKKEPLDWAPDIKKKDYGAQSYKTKRITKKSIYTDSVLGIEVFKTITFKHKRKLSEFVEIAGFIAVSSDGTNMEAEELDDYIFDCFSKDSEKLWDAANKFYKYFSHEKFKLNESDERAANIYKYFKRFFHKRLVNKINEFDSWVNDNISELKEVASIEEEFVHKPTGKYIIKINGKFRPKGLEFYK